MGSKDPSDQPRQGPSILDKGEPSLRPWRPRRLVVEAEEAAVREGGAPPPVSLDSLAEDSGPVALPEPPPPGPGDDLRLPNPDRWGAGSGLPVWFWIIGAVMILGGTLAIVWDSPEYIEPEMPEKVGEQ
ncbi:MAG: hypothetical protein ACI8RZ_004046 [Myxococcota bacterium]|jgi:hypothetical protein